jgi:hypothetical protein
MAEFTNPLRLVSPLEKTGRAKDAQFLLAGNNEFKQNFHPGDVDGEFGPASAAATKRAKYMLGYPQSAVDSSFGQTLYEMLTGKKKLTPANQALREQRMKAEEAHGGAKKQALAAALEDAKNSVHEEGDNLTPFGKWYGMDGQPWCAMYVTYRLVHAGFDGFEQGKFASYCGSVVDAAKHGQRHLALTTDPEPGDIVIYNGDEHIEFFVDWVDKPNTFKAVGGNTSAHDGSPSNGGEVAVNTRSRSGGFRATCFIRVGA